MGTSASVTDYIGTDTSASVADYMGTATSFTDNVEVSGMFIIGGGTVVELREKQNHQLTLRNVVLPPVVAIGDHVFKSCARPTSVTLSDIHQHRLLLVL